MKVTVMAFASSAPTSAPHTAPSFLSSPPAWLVFVFDFFVCACLCPTYLRALACISVDVSCILSLPTSPSASFALSSLPRGLVDTNIHPLTT